MPAVRLRGADWPLFHSGRNHSRGSAAAPMAFGAPHRLIVAVLLFSFGCWAGAQKIPGLNHPFSAVAHITINHQPPLQAHIYMDQGRQRIDFDSTNPGMAGAYQLIFISEKKTYLVLPETHRCLPADLSHLPGPARQAVGAELARAVPRHARTLPDAVVDGQRCQVQEWQEKRDGATVTIRMWTTRDARQLPLQMQISSAGGPAMRVHYTDVQAGRPAAALFTLPRECRQFPSH